MASLMIIPHRPGSTNAAIGHAHHQGQARTGRNMYPFTNNSNMVKTAYKIETSLIIKSPKELTEEPVTLGDHLRRRRLELGLYQKNVAIRRNSDWRDHLNHLELGKWLVADWVEMYAEGRRMPRLQSDKPVDKELTIMMVIKNIVPFDSTHDNELKKPGNIKSG